MAEPGLRIRFDSTGGDKVVREIGAMRAETQRYGGTVRDAIAEERAHNASLGRIAHAYRESAAAGAKQRAEEEILNRIRRQGIDLISQEGRMMEAELRTRQRLTASIEQSERAYRQQAAAQAGQGRSFALNAASALGYAGALLTLMNVIRGVTRETREAEDAQAQLRAALDSTRGASGLTIDELNEMADGLSKIAAVDDEVISKAQALALAFTDVGRAVFPRAMAAAMDLAVRKNMDLASATEMVFKALQEPEEALALLERSVGRFTDAEEKMIISLAKAGKEEEAQIELLRLLEVRVGGAAAAHRDTLGGALDALGVAWGNLLERIGTGNTDLRESVEGMVSALTSLTEHWQTAEAVAGSVLVETNAQARELKALLADISGLAGSINFPGLAEFIRAGVQIQQVLFNPLAQFRAARDLYNRYFGEPTSQTERPRTPHLIPLPQPPKEPAAPPIDEEAAKRRQQLLVQLAQERAMMVENIRFQKEMAAAYAVGENAVESATKAHNLRAFALQAEDKYGKALAASLIALKDSELEAAAAAEDASDAAKKAVEERKQAEKEFVQLIVQSGKAMRDWAAAGQERKRQIEEQTAAVTESIEAIRRETDLIRSTSKLTGFDLSRALGLADVEDGVRRVVGALRQVSGETDEAFRVRVAGAAREARDALMELANERFGAELERWVEEPMQQAAESMKSELLDAISVVVAGGKVQWADLWQSFLQSAIRAIEEWLIRWIIAHRAAQAEAARTAAVNAAAGGGGGGGGGWLSAAGGLFSRGGGGATGGGAVAGGGPWGANSSWAGTSSSAGTSTTASGGAWSTWGTYAAYAFLAWVGIKIFQGWTKAKVRWKLDEGAMRELQTTFKGLAADLGLLFAEFNAAAVRIEKSKHGFNVKVALAGVSEFFRSYEEAIEFAKVQAIKAADLSRSASDFVQAAIRASRARTIESLKSDIEFARMLETQNLPDIGRQISDMTNALILNTQRVLELFSRDLPNMVLGLQSVFTNFANGLQAAYNSLMGIKENPAEIWERNRDAYNAQLRITKVQLALLYAEIQTKLALIAVQSQYLRMLGGGSGRPGLESRPTEGVRPVLPKGGRQTYMDPGEPPIGGTMEELYNWILAFIQYTLAQLPGLITGGMPPGVGGRRGGGGGGVSGGGDPLQALIDDQRRAEAQRGMTDYQRQQDDINRKYDEAIASRGLESNALQRATRERDRAIRAANGDAEAIKRANEAYDRATRHIERTQRAIDEANEARERELQLLREQHQEEVGRTAAGYAGRRSSWDDRLKDVEDFFAALEKEGRKETGIADWRRRILERESYERIGVEAVAGLGDPVAQFAVQLDGLGQTMRFLTENARQLGITEEDLGRIRAEMQDRTFLGLADQMARYITDEDEKRKLAEMRYQIEKAQMLTMIEMAHAMKAITDAQYVELLRLYGLLPATAPGASGPPRDDSSSRYAARMEAEASAREESARLFEDAVKRFAQSTESLIQAFTGIFTDASLGGTGRERLSVAEERYRQIAAQALAGDIEARSEYGTASRAYLEALNEFNAGGSLFAAERARIRDEFQQLIGATTFLLNGISSSTLFGSGGGAAVQIAAPPSGFGGAAVTVNNNDVTGLLREIGVAIRMGNDTALPVLRSISNHTNTGASGLTTLVSDLERLIALLKAAA